LQRSLHKSLEEDAKNATLHEKGLLKEIKSLKSQLAAKEKERVKQLKLSKIWSQGVSLLWPNLRQRPKILIF
jgi:hypothetical protein